MGIINLDRDLIAAKIYQGSTTSGSKTGAQVIPANETIVLMQWLNIRDSVMDNGKYIGGWTNDNTGNEALICKATSNANEMNMSSYHSAWQDLTVTTTRDQLVLYTLVVDRDNTQLEAWKGNTKVDSAALTKDPTLSATRRMWLGSSGGNGATVEVARVALLSITNGNTPSASAWARIFGAMEDPYATMPTELSSVIGTCYSDYYPGEGIYTTATVTDVGTNGNDITWAGGVICQQVRTRTQVPYIRPGNDHFTLKTGYTATTGSFDPGLAVQPLIVRMCVGPNKNLANNPIVQITDAAAANYIKYEDNGGSDQSRVFLRSGAGNRLTSFVRDQRAGGDVWVVCSGTDFWVYLNGQIINSTTLAAAMDLAGNDIQVLFNGNGGSACRISVWNPSSLPGTLLADIRSVVNNVDISPLNLGTPIVDFPLRGDVLAAGASTLANQGSSGTGTLTLSAIRSTSCKILIPEI